MISSAAAYLLARAFATDEEHPPHCQCLLCGHVACECLNDAADEQENAA